MEALFYPHLLLSLTLIHQVTQGCKETRWQDWLLSPVYGTTSLSLANINWIKPVVLWGLGWEAVVVVEWIYLYLSPFYYVCFSSHS